MTDPLLMMGRGSNPPNTRRVNKSAPAPPQPAATPAPIVDDSARYGTSRMNAVQISNGEPAPVKRRKWAATLAAVAAVLGAAGLFVVRQHPSWLSLGRAQGTSSAGIEAPSPPHVDRPPVPAEPAPHPSPDPVPSAAAIAPPEIAHAAIDAGSPTTRKSHGGAPKPAAAAPPHPQPAAAPAKPQADCDPPYTIDAAGRRIFKVECM
jgi:serine/threonine-protein kinase